MICSSRPVPSVATTSAWVSPRVNSAEPWVRGSTPVRIVIGRTVRVSRPSMRGSPFRMRLRTMPDSMLKKMSFSSVADGGLSTPSASATATRLRISPRRAERSCLLVMRKASSMSALASSVTRAISASLPAGACQSHSGLPATSTSSLMALIAFCICSWPNTTAPSMTCSGSSCASDSTISTAAWVPATTRFIWLVCSSVAVGFRMYWPSA